MKKLFLSITTLSLLGSIQLVKAAAGELQTQSKVDQQDVNERLLDAIRGQNSDRVRVLLEDNHANPNYIDDKGKSALHIAVEQNPFDDQDIDAGAQYRQILLLLCEHRANTNYGDPSSGDTPLFFLMRQNPEDDTIQRATQILIEFGNADVNYRNHAGNTPLTILLSENSHIIEEPLDQDKAVLVQILLERYHAHSTICDNERNTPLMHAVSNNLIHCVRLLIANKAAATINDLNSQGETALIKSTDFLQDTVIATIEDEAAGNVTQSHPIVQLLLQHRADPNIANTLGRTPLMDFAEMGDFSIIQLLIHYGADPSLTDKAGKTAQDLATENLYSFHHTQGPEEPCNHQCEDVCRRYFLTRALVNPQLISGLQMNKRDEEGNTDLIRAIEEQDFWMVQYLLTQKVNVDRCRKISAYLETPLGIAAVQYCRIYQNPSLPKAEKEEKTATALSIVTHLKEAGAKALIHEQDSVAFALRGLSLEEKESDQPRKMVRFTE